MELNTALDPVTLAVLRGRLEQVADEMDATLPFVWIAVLSICISDRPLVCRLLATRGGRFATRAGRFEFVGGCMWYKRRGGCWRRSQVLGLDGCDSRSQLACHCSAASSPAARVRVAARRVFPVSPPPRVTCYPCVHVLDSGQWRVAGDVTTMLKHHTFVSPYKCVETIPQGAIEPSGQNLAQRDNQERKPIECPPEASCGGRDLTGVDLT